MTTKEAIEWTLDAIGNIVFNVVTMTIILNIGIAYIIHEYTAIYEAIVAWLTSGGP